jgi:valyl-tRNA synthetase
MADINDKLLKPYNSQETEDRIYKLWEDSGFFNPDNLPERHKTPFTIVMPPPNVTGVLHMGHALGLTIQDVFIRYKRMCGFKTLWVPGTDHAAIATQSKVEKEIQKKEGKSRHDLGREELIKRVEQFAKESHDTIVSQIRIMGASCDWSREAFTLDEQRNKAVQVVFKMMHDDGLIYRGHRIVNWDPKGQTTISDDEILYEERKSVLYTFRYSKDFPIAISTTRPETKVGDTAVAVHPDDPRYQAYVGKEYDFEFYGVPVHVKIIADKEVDMEYGTGALGVTPAHSQIDWQIAERHDLPKKQVINEYAKMMVGDERLLGKKTTDARTAIVEWLRSENLLIDEKETVQNISTAERTGGIVEPLPKLQWFVAVTKPFIIKDSKIDGIASGSKITLKELMQKAVENGQIDILPEHFQKTYFHWIHNLRDWCISRQIWYGHRIPVWYKDDEIMVSPETTPGSDWKQDEDTLDTWFSSGLWTFSTLGWPELTKDLETFHPTDLIVPAYEILFFWIARMILMTGYTLGTIPFKKVYLTGIVRDAQGRKFSKSLGNGIDPIEIAKKYGADAGRMAVIYGTAPGTDSKISDDKIKGYKHFSNKLWNITRFILESTNGIYDTKDFNDWTQVDKDLLTAFNEMLTEFTQEIENDKIHIAAERIYLYAWHELADKIIEESKPMLRSDDQVVRKSRAHMLMRILTDLLKALHPFMPFVTEEVWSMMPIANKKLLMIEDWPQHHDSN